LLLRGKADWTNFRVLLTEIHPYETIITNDRAQPAIDTGLLFPVAIIDIL